MATQVPAGGLTSVEKSLVKHVSRGEWLDLAAEDEAVDEASMRLWVDSRTCRASVIRGILRGRLVADPDPHGLRLRGARITGRLDLENLATDVNLELADCLLEEGILARDARLACVVLARCHIEHPAEPPLDGARLTCSVLDLSGARIIGDVGDGGVILYGACIGGQLSCDGTQLSNDSGPALFADGLQVGQGMFLRNGFTATGSGDGGAVRLPGAHIGRQLSCIGAQLHNDSGPALFADGLQVGQDMFLRNEFTATGSSGAGAVRLVGAHIGGQLDCGGAKLRNDSGPALHADSLQVGHAVVLSGGFTATGAGVDGAVRLVGAHIGSQFDCGGAKLRNDSGPALLADALQVGQDMQCDNLTADGGVVLGGHIGRLLSFEGAALNNSGGSALVSDGLLVDGTMFCRNGFTAQGEVRLSGARIGGRLYFDGAKLSNPGGRAFVASRLTVGQDMFCRKQKAPQHEQPFLVEGAVDLRGAHIGGHLDCTEAQLRNDSGPALNADHLQVDQDMLLTDGLAATSGGGDSAVRLSGAHIGGRLECDGASLCNKSGPALYADHLLVDQSMFLRYWFTATGSSSLGAVYLVGAHISGHLDCTGAELSNDSGPALDAYSLQVGQGVHLTGGFTATGSGDDGAINLNGAHIGGSLVCDGASLGNDSGPALTAYGLHAAGGRGVFFRSGFTATGAGETGAIRLISAHIRSDLNCTGATLRNDSGPALIAGGLHVGQGMHLTGGFTATGGGDDVAVDLRGTQVGGMLVFDPARLEHAADPHQRLEVDGLTYASVPQPISAQEWLDLLRDGTPGYAAQPYQQLAAGYRALGDDRQARKVLMAQRDNQLARSPTSWPERWWGHITKITLGYGYKPWRALLFLAAVVAVSCVLAAVLGSHGALAQTSKTATPGQSCTVVQQVSVGLDLNLPVGTSVARADCDLTTDSASATATWLTIASWILRVLAWVFAALFIAGFTSAVRKK